ncbi:hypothetical protein [Flavobacterium sp.]|uniref:hypothetical protein n=1 Tax=Flavobacterium sp. TaxID=239 RepID=UPI002FDCD2EC
MSKVYDLMDLMNDASFCDYIEEIASKTGRTYSEVYDKILDDNMYCEVIVDGYLKR